MSGACALDRSSVAVVAAAFGVACSAAPTYAEVAARAVVTPVHDVIGDGSRAVCSQCPRGRLCTKGGVSEQPEDKNSDPRGTEPHLRAAGCVRGPVVGSSPGWRNGAQKARGAVTPSVHLGVPKSLAVTPGHGKGLRQQLGWKKVCGTAHSWIWVLKGESRGYALPSTPDLLGVVWME